MVRQFALTTKAFILTFTIFAFYSCSSYTDYKPIKDKSIDSSDTLITATARMWQGEYLSIDIYIKRTDSPLAPECLELVHSCLLVKPVCNWNTLR